MYKITTHSKLFHMHYINITYLLKKYDIFTSSKNGNHNIWCNTKNVCIKYLMILVHLKKDRKIGNYIMLNIEKGQVTEVKYRK